MTAPELRSFHLGIVVRSLDETLQQYSAMFDVERWHRQKWRFNGLEMAYGRGGGQTFELFEVTGPGDSHIHQFFDQRGPGVNHIGFWCEDVAGAAQRAVAAGAELMTLTADPEGNATATLIPPPDVAAQHFEHLGLVTFVNPSGGVLVEYVGRAGEEYLRGWFKDDFPNVVIDSPWLA